METWFRILGPLEVFDGSQWCTLGAAKWRALLAALITQPGQALSTDQITDELWGEHPPRTAVNQVHTYVMRLRQVLRQEGRLVTRPPGYLLAADRTEIDAGQFAELTVAADAALRSGDAAGAGRRYAAALAMWRGPAFAGVPPSPRVTAEAARLEELRLAAVEGRIDADLRCGRHGTLIGELRSLLDEHPLRERL
jgi:DNA-binding SARP family transcriptional activator